MNDNVDEQSVSATYKTTNYLDNPIVSAYYHSKEIKAYYASLKHVDNKRDYYSTLVSEFEIFFTLLNEDTVNQLDLYVFNKETKSKSAVSKNAEESLRHVHPEGHDLLHIESPLTLEALKGLYRKAEMKSHPDRGGTHHEMILINEAYKIYHAYLCAIIENSGDSSSIAIDDLLKYEPKNVNDYVNYLKFILAEVFCDEWDLINSYKIIQLLENDKYLKKLLKLNYEVEHRLIRLLSVLTKRLAAADMLDKANDVMKITEYIYKLGKYTYAPYIDGPLKIITGEKKLRVIINHLCQAENALTFGVISNKKYEALQKKFSSVYKLGSDIENNFEELLKTHGFIDELPYDECVIKNIK